MRCFVLVAALMGLTACGGEMLPEETQVPASTQEITSEQVAAPSQEGISQEALCTGSSWECMCAQYKTQATCRAIRSCLWYNNRCQPTYE